MPFPEAVIRLWHKHLRYMALQMLHCNNIN